MQIKHQLNCSSTALVWLFSSGLLYLGFLSNIRALQPSKDWETMPLIDGSLETSTKTRTTTRNRPFSSILSRPSWLPKASEHKDIPLRGPDYVKLGEVDKTLDPEPSAVSLWRNPPKRVLRTVKGVGSNTMEKLFAPNKLHNTASTESTWKPDMPIKNVNDAEFFSEHFDSKSFTKYIRGLELKSPNSKTFESFGKLTNGPGGISPEMTISRILTLYLPLTLVEVSAAKNFRESLEASRIRIQHVPDAHKSLTNAHQSAPKPVKDPALTTPEAQVKLSDRKLETTLSTNDQILDGEKQTQQFLGSLHTFVLKHQIPSAMDPALSRQITKAYVDIMTRYYQHPGIVGLALQFHDYLSTKLRPEFVYKLDSEPEFYHR